jgi:hypothetical protein
MKTGILFFFCKMFQGQAKEKKTPEYILYSSTDELISKMESKLQNKVFFHDLKTENSNFKRFSRHYYRNNV